MFWENATVEQSRGIELCFQGWTWVVVCDELKASLTTSNLPSALGTGQFPSSVQVSLFQEFLSKEKCWEMKYFKNEQVCVLVHTCLPSHSF